MGVAQPVLGYPSKTAAAVALRASGRSLAVISQMIGVPTANVSALLASADRSRTGLIRIRVSDRTQSFLQSEADLRGRSVGELVIDLLDALTEDELVGAVLDDAFRDELEDDRG